MDFLVAPGRVFHEFRVELQDLASAVPECPLHQLRSPRCAQVQGMENLLSEREWHVHPGWEETGGDHLGARGPRAYMDSGPRL